MKYLVIGCIFTFVFALSSAFSNAVFSISTVLCCLMIIYLKLWDKIDITELNIRPVMIAYLIFWISLIIPSVLLGDKYSIIKSFDYFYYSLPLIILFYMKNIINGNIMDEVIVYSMSSSVLFTCGYVLACAVMLPFGTRIQGFYGNPNHFATLLILVLPFIALFLLEKKSNNFKMAYLFVALSLGIVGLVLTGSRGGILGFIIGGCIVGVAKFCCLKTLNIEKIKKYIFVFVLLTVSFIVIFGNLNGGFKRHYDMERVYLLQSSYAMWNDNKILGVGLANWHNEYIGEYILPKAVEPSLDMPHNTIAFFFSTTGIIGGIGFLLFNCILLIFLYKQMKLRPKNIYIQAMLWSLIAVNLHGFVDVGITMKSAMRLFSGLVGITLASVYELERLKL